MPWGLGHACMQVTREVFAAAKGRLKVVGRAGVGVDNVALAPAPPAPSPAAAPPAPCVSASSVAVPPACSILIAFHPWRGLTGLPALREKRPEQDGQAGNGADANPAS